MSLRCNKCQSYIKDGSRLCNKDALEDSPYCATHRERQYFPPEDAIPNHQLPPMPRYPEIDDDMVVDDDMTVEELRELLQKREADLQAIQSALTNKEADNRVLAGIVQDLRAKVSALEKNVQHQGDVEILEYSVQKAIETIMKLKKRIAELESQQTSQQRRQLTTAEVEDLKGKFDKLMGDLVADEIDDKEFMRIYRRDFLAGRD